MDKKKVPVFLIAAPIGDILSDFSLTALETLKRVENVFMEDIHLEHPDLLQKRLRRRGVLTDKHRIHLISSREGESAHFALVDGLVRQRKPFALLADKGMPCFLDPGRELVRHLVEHHEDEIELVPLGASSALDAAIMMSGVDCSQFTFLGHFPDCRHRGREAFSLRFPNICYVAGEAWMEFVDWLKELLGDDCQRARLCACSNIRQLQNRRRMVFRLTEPRERFQQLDDYTRSEKEAAPTPNHVVVVYWDKPVEAVVKTRGAENSGGYFYLYLNKLPCDANCIFCSRADPAFKDRIRREAEQHDFQKELATIRAQIKAWSNPRVFHIGGHEPAIYPTLVPIVRAAAEKGFSRIVIESNGMALDDVALVGRLEEAGLHEARLPIYGVTAEVHDAVTGIAGSFERLMRAMELLRRAGIKLLLKTVVLRQNLRQLEDLFARYPDLGCSLVMPASADAEHYRHVCPRLSEIPRSISARMGNIHLPCLFGPRPNWRDPSPQAEGGWVVLDGGHMVYQGNTQNLSPEQMLQRRIKPLRCRPCRMFERCSGIYPLYLEIYGEEELSPVP